MLNLRVAVRSLSRSPGFTATAVLTLVLGIGGISAIFSVVNSVLLKPLAGVDTERLVTVSEKWPRYDGGSSTVPAYREWRRLTDVFEEVGATQNCKPNLTGLGEPEQLNATCATASWFDVHKAIPLLGRTFLPDEEQAVVLDHGFWMRRFGGDRRVIGRTLTLDQKSYTVVGVMAADFEPRGKGNTDLYLPWVVDRNESIALYVTARLQRGVPIEQAAAALSVVSKRLALENQDDAAVRAVIVPLLETTVGPYRDLLRILMAAAGLMLLVACVNAANLFLARGAGRSRETQIRAALGANRKQLMAPALAESAIVSVTGGSVGLVAAWGIARMVAVHLENFSRASEIRIDARVTLVTLGCTLLTVFVCGLAPSFSKRPAGSGTLVIGEVALTFVLLICSGLLIRSFIAMRQVDLGYNPHGVIVGFVAQPEDPRDRRDAAVSLRRRVRERVSQLPGVESVATSSRVPSGGMKVSMTVVREGEDPNRPAKEGEKLAEFVVSSGEYFHVAGIRLREGRTFTERDNASAPLTAIVSQSIADRYFDGRALGHRVLFPDLGFNLKRDSPYLPREIVGVAADIKETSVRQTGLMSIYLPEGQSAARYTNIVVRASTGDPMRLERAIRQVMFEEAPELALTPMRPLDALNSYLTDTPRRAMWLLGLLAAVALALASVGVHGIVAYTTARRSREMGIRTALGARPEQLFGLVTRQALRMAIIGAAMGAVLAYLCAGLLRALLFGVERTDPVTYGAAALILLVVAALASIAPALHAARTDSAVALRAE